MSHRAPERSCSALRPQLDARNDWREHLRAALANTGHTHDSVATAIGMVRKCFSRLFDRVQRRNLTATHLESLRDNPCTRDAWLAFLQLHALTGDAVLIDARADGLAHSTRLARLMREAADVTCGYAEMLADDDLDDIERAKLDRELGELGDAIAAARLGLRQKAAV